MKSINIKIIAIALTTSLFYGCSKDFLDINENGNAALTGDVGLLLTSAESNIAGEFTTGLGFGGAVYARQLYGLGTSTYAIDGSTYQGDWNSLYSSSIKDLYEIRQVAEANGNDGYLGISKILSAYVFHQLVDYFGDIPYTQASQGETILTPMFDDDAAVYAALLISLDEAIADLTQATTDNDRVTGDIMLNGSYPAWIRVANTLKLKMYLNLSNVDAPAALAGINAIVTDGRFIGTPAQDWQLNFTNQVTPNNRHPFYNSEYSTSPGYLDNFMMLSMVQRNDPRLRFYFYRQAEYSDLDFQTTPCSSRTDCDTWDALEATGTNYIGRDHGDPSGLPGDDNLVTVPGIYPVGGKYDDSSFRTVNGLSTNTLNRGAEGAGLMPLFTSSMTHFMFAEAALRLGVTTPLSAAAHFNQGMVDSFDKVRAFALAKNSTTANEASRIASTEAANSIVWATVVNLYTGNVNTEFTNGTTNQQLNLVMQQKNLASWGNGMEPYTDFRRTGFPNNFPLSLAPSGAFPLRVLYPDSEISSNPNTPTGIAQSVPVFWDNN